MAQVDTLTLFCEWFKSDLKKTLILFLIYEVHSDMYIMQYVSYELLQSNYKLSQMKTKTQPVVSKDFLLHSLCYLLFHVSRYLDYLYLFYVVLVNNCVLLNIRMKITVFNFLLVSTHTCSASCSHFV